MTEEQKADIVLEGGGVKGIALAGALSVLMDRGYRFERIAGTSAGAIVGALLAAGRTADELREIMGSTDYNAFQDTSWLDRLPGGKILSVLIHDGVYEGEYLKSWLQEVLGDVETFAQLRLPDDPDSTLDEDRRYKLVVNVSDVSLGRLVRFPWDYQRIYQLPPGEQRIVDAVRASMSIPFFFQPARVSYHRVKGGRPTKTRSVLVDGGMLSNFPVDIFDRDDGKPPRWPTFGIKLSSRPDALCDTFPKDVDGPTELSRAMIGTLCSFRDAMHVDKAAVQERTIFVDTLGVKATDFDLDQDTQSRLYDSGVRAAEQFLEGWDFDEYKRTHRPDPQPDQS